MTSTCRITRKGAGALNDTTGNYGGTPSTIYDGACKFVMDDDQPNDIEAQAQHFAQQRPRLDLPVSTSVTINVDDEFEITEDDHDTRLVGIKGRIAGLHMKTYATARRFPVEVLS